MAHIVLALIEQSNFFKNQAPVAEAETPMKDLNDNVPDHKPTNNDQWDFLGETSDKNNNSQEERCVEATGGGEKIGFIIEGREEEEESPKVVQDPPMLVELSPPVASSSSSSMDINCNICVTTETESKDLIDFDSPQHQPAVQKRPPECLEKNVDQVDVFKLDEEELKLNASPSHILPDSPASVTSSMHSTDADSGCETYPNHDGSFSTPPQPTPPSESSGSLAKRFKMSSSLSGGEEDETEPPLKTERSLSSESLNSEASMESNDSKSSLRLMSNRFSKNGTLERQTSTQSVVAEKPALVVAPTGLQVLVLWNNKLSKKCSQPISDMLKATTTLEVLNVGMNILGNEFVAGIKSSLCANESISKLGLQSIHLTCSGAKIIAEAIEAKSGSPLTRVDLRDNNIQVPGLQSLHEAVKINKGVTQIDLNLPQPNENTVSEVRVKVKSSLCNM